MVLNPITNTYVNVAPIFEAMAQVEEDDDNSPRAAQLVIRNAARMLNSCRAVELFTNLQYNSLTLDLYVLEDAFEQMCEIRR